MKKFLISLLVFGLILSVSGLAMAGSSDTQSVTYSVSAINEIAITGGTRTLAVTAATAGSAPTAVTDTGSTYAITTNQTGCKITGVIDTAMSTGVTLKINLTAPTGATGGTDVTLSATAADLVTAITKLNESGKTITYTLSATSAAGVVASASKTVTLTVTGGT